MRFAFARVALVLAPTVLGVGCICPPPIPIDDIPEGVMPAKDGIMVIDFGGMRERDGAAVLTCPLRGSDPGGGQTRPRSDAGSLS